MLPPRNNSDYVITSRLRCLGELLRVDKVALSACDQRATPGPEVRRVWYLRDAEAFELDVGSSGALEQTGAVAEQHGGDAHEDLVEHSGVEALTGRVGPEDVDVLVAGRCFGGGYATLEVLDESLVPWR
jgi:hypothetical protein